MTEGESVKN